MKQFLILYYRSLPLQLLLHKKMTTWSQTCHDPASPAAAILPKKKDWSKVDLSHRANDHFMAQLGWDGLVNMPDTLTSVGISRSFSFYFMLDFPFKSDARLSAAAGLGIGSHNYFFSNEQQPLSVIPTAESSGGNHYKKYKFVTTYLEVPLELRYALDPEHTNNSWKFAVGAKVGILLSGYAKGKNVENSAGQVIQAVVEKQRANTYFNNVNLAGTIRISKGPVGIFAQMAAVPVIKASYSTAMYPFTIGICLSGL